MYVVLFLILIHGVLSRNLESNEYMNDVLLSIIIPAYNYGRFLSKTLSMLISQGLDHCEVIVVNDGSTDDTEKICKEFSKEYENIHYFFQKNQGVSVARNVGLREAKGKYVYFFDSDDSLPDKTLDFFRYILSKNNSLDIFVFGYAVKKGDILYKKVFSDTLDNELLDSFMMKKIFFEKKLSFLICSSLYNREFILANDIFFPVGIKIGEDIVFMINAITNAQSLYYSKRISFIYQIRDDSVMQGYKGYNMDRMRSFEVVRDTIMNNAEYYSLVKKEANFFIANSYLSNLVAYLKSNLKDKEINKIFLDNKFFLYQSLQGRFLNTAAIYIARFMPFRILFKLLK